MFTRGRELLIQVAVMWDSVGIGPSYVGIGLGYGNRP